MELVNRNLLDPRRNRPLVAEGIYDRRHPISMNGAGWFLNRLRTGFYGAPLNGIHIADVNV